jgi:hypothetical protein
MPITTEQIAENNGNKSYRHMDIPLVTFIMNWVITTKVIFPKWQREDCWPDEYRVQLIESILTKSDIPKFYLSTVNNGNTYYLLDGGHRTRAIKRYILNEYPIEIDGEKVYYDIVPINSSKRSNRILNTFEKELFDTYHLTLTIYENLTEKDSRKTFNILQNSQPMTMADIVNSYESPLIDYLRSLYTYSIGGQILEQIAATSLKDCYLPKNMNSKLIYHLASIWTICFPLNATNPTEKINSSLKYTLKGEKRSSSMCYKYIQEYNEPISDEQKEYFQGILENYISSIKDIDERGHTFKTGECMTMIHGNIYVPNFSLDKYWEMIDDERKLEMLEKKAKSHMETGDADEYDKIKEACKILDMKYGHGLSEWSKGYTNINKDHMTRRYNLVKKYCTDTTHDSGSNTLDEDCVHLSTLSE